jgi:hypothetical protein
MMSRHEIQHKSLLLTVGWDSGLQTFFGQLDDEDMPAGEEMILWVGTTPYALPTVEALEAALRPYWELDTETIADLQADQAAQAPLTPLQRAMLHFLGTTAPAPGEAPACEVPHGHLCPRCVEEQRPLPVVACFKPCPAEDERLCARHRA